MWKAAGGVEAGSSPLEAALPTAASQRKSVHSSWKVPSGVGAWMDTASLPHVTRPEGKHTSGFTPLKAVGFVDGYRSQNGSCPPPPSLSPTPSIIIYRTYQRAFDCSDSFGEPPCCATDNKREKVSLQCLFGSLQTKNSISTLGTANTQRF